MVLHSNRKVTKTELVQAIMMTDLSMWILGGNWKMTRLCAGEAAGCCAQGLLSHPRRSLEEDGRADRHMVGESARGFRREANTGLETTLVILWQRMCLNSAPVLRI